VRTAERISGSVSFRFLRPNDMLMTRLATAQMCHAPMLSVVSTTWIAAGAKFETAIFHTCKYCRLTRCIHDGRTRCRSVCRSCTGPGRSLDGPEEQGIARCCQSKCSGVLNRKTMHAEEPLNLAAAAAAVALISSVHLPSPYTIPYLTSSIHRSFRFPPKSMHLR